jgi:hypothetical protein
MGDFPLLHGQMPMPILTTIDPRIVPVAEFMTLRVGAAAAASWPAAGRAIGVKVVVARPLVVKRAAWINGASVSGNVSIGIYNDDTLERMVSASAAQAGVSVVQAVDLTDTLLLPGAYIMAMSTDGTSQFVRTAINGIVQRSMSVSQATSSAYPLPATWPWDTVPAAQSFIPVMSFACGPDVL